MTRRLILAILGTAAAALVLAGLGTFLFSARAARTADERELRRQVADIAELATDPDDVAVQRIITNLAFRKLLQVSDSSVIRVDAQNRLVGPLPVGVASDILTAQDLTAGQSFSGRSRRTTYAATVLQGAGRSRLVVILTRRDSLNALGALRWNALSSVVVIVLGAVVATVLGRRLTKPIRLADDAARRIASGELATRIPEPAAHDTDELAQLIRSVNHMASSLERSQAVEQQFLMSVSHDLRTPLTSIRGFAEAITDGTAKDPSAAAAVILNSSRRLERLVQDLLDLSKLQARAFSMKHELVDLAVAAVAATESLATNGIDGIDVRADTDGTVPVDGDRDRIDQVIANLVENAAKFARASIVVGACCESGVAILWVDDDGPGISPEDRPHVFERLYVSAHQPTRSESGSGLGLAIVHELVSAMGGSVAAEGSPLGGARLVIRFPLA